MILPKKLNLEFRPHLKEDRRGKQKLISQVPASNGMSAC